jgi:hypothetical protein
MGGLRKDLTPAERKNIIKQNAKSYVISSNYGELNELGRTD